MRDLPRLAGGLATEPGRRRSQASSISFVLTLDCSDGQEAFFLEVCGYPIDFEGTRARRLFTCSTTTPASSTIHNFRLFETFSANGKTVEVRPDSGPDVVWVVQDGDVYLASSGSSVTGSGVGGRSFQPEHRS